MENTRTRPESFFMKKTYITKSEAETLALGERIAKTLKGGEVIGLSGELGAGKSVLVRGIARGLGITKPITSPTFTIMNVYLVRGNKRGIKQFVHVDGYRLSRFEELRDIGLAEHLFHPESVVCVEWAEKFSELIRDGRLLKIGLSYGKGSPSERRIIIHNHA